MLSEAHSEEVDQADPFYAHCKLHSDKSLVRRRRRNWLALQMRAQYRQQMLKQPNHLDTDEQRRIQRKLAKHRHKYLAHKASRPPPWGKMIFSFKCISSTFLITYIDYSTYTKDATFINYICFCLPSIGKKG